MRKRPPEPAGSVPAEWPAWKVVAAALWPVVILASYLGKAALPILVQVLR